MRQRQPEETDRTQALLAEIARPGSTRASIAAVYAEGIWDCQSAGVARFVDWPRVNRALLTRYTVSGLQFIKARGWTFWDQKIKS